LGQLATDRQRLAVVRAASLLLAGEGDQGVEYLRLYLYRAGYPAPPARTLQQLTTGLMRLGWKTMPTCLLPPVSGSFFVQTTDTGEALRLGIVGVTHRATVDKEAPALRDWFLVAQAEEGRAERVTVESVSFWLVPPNG
jgi:hypothetical protein